MGDVLTEADLKDKVMERLRKLFPTAFIWKISDKWYNGIPDIFFLYRGVTIFIELKRPGKEPEPKQRHTLAKIAANGAFSFWADNLDDVIKRVLYFVERYGSDRNQGFDPNARNAPSVPCAPG